MSMAENPFLKWIDAHPLIVFEVALSGRGLTSVKVALGV